MMLAYSDYDVTISWSFMFELCGSFVAPVIIVYNFSSYWNFANPVFICLFLFKAQVFVF